VIFNPLSWNRTAVVTLPEGIEGLQKLSSGHWLGIASAPALGWSVYDHSSKPLPVSVSKEKDGKIILQNNFLRATFDCHGNLVSVIHVPTNRESLEITNEGKGNQFVLFEDMPFFWDAWDVMIYHTQKRINIHPDPASIKIAEEGPLRVAINILPHI
jgi:alpha-mannosidase